MVTLYKKAGNRKYEELKHHEFSGFPSDGIWMVFDNHYSFICPKYKFSPINVPFFIRREKIISNLFNTNKSLMESILDAVNFFVEEPDKGYTYSASEILYVKKNNRYKKYGEQFIGFPSSGIFEVYDGKNNGITFLGHFSEFPVIQVDILKTLKIPEISRYEKSWVEYVSDVLYMLSTEYEKVFNENKVKP